MKQKCNKCNVEKEWTLEYYHTCKQGKYLLRTCKDCINKKRREKYQKTKLLPKIKILEKKCTKCKKRKNIIEFSVRNSNKDGHHTKCKECANKEWSKRNSGKENTIDSLIKTSIKYAKKRAKKKGLEFNLTKEFIYKLYEKQEGFCALSGIKMEHKSGHEKYRINPYNLSIDRIDSTQGYIQSNIQFTCGIINVMKNQMDQDEFIKICKQIAQKN